MTDADLKQLAAEAYMYGYPLVENLRQVLRYVETGVGSNPAAPFNSFSHATSLAGPDDTFVTINNDTVYSMASLDLSGSPQALTVPDMGERYHVLQFVSAWTDNFAYVGTRATGNRGGNYLIVPPAWAGDAPAELTVIRAPTNVVSIVGRIACDGPSDLPAVRTLQDRLELRAVDPDAPDGGGVPSVDGAVSNELLFFEQLRRWLAAFPPNPEDAEYQTRFAPLGLLDASGTPYVDPDPTLAHALTDGAVAGHEKIATILRSGTRPKVNGWSNALHTFDYNRHYFELGTINAPEWIASDANEARIERAIAALGGLWGNHGYEADYAAVYVDDDGAQLNGAHKYEIRFAEAPPCDAFWSITMYDTPNFYMVANPIDRYSIGDRTDGLMHRDDGSLVVFIQHDEPITPESKANWLPSPSGDFRPVLRIYAPRAEVLDGTYVLPPVIEVE